MKKLFFSVLLRLLTIMANQAQVLFHSPCSRFIMKKSILLVSAFCFALSTQIQTAAADGNNACFNPFQVKQQVEQLAKQMSLIGTQKEQFMEIFKQQYIKSQLPPNSISDEARSSLKSLLTEEQFIQFNVLNPKPLKPNYLLISGIKGLNPWLKQFGINADLSIKHLKEYLNVENLLFLLSVQCCLRVVLALLTNN